MSSMACNGEEGELSSNARTTLLTAFGFCGGDGTVVALDRWQTSAGALGEPAKIENRFTVKGG